MIKNKTAKANPQKWTHYKIALNKIQVPNNKPKIPKSSMNNSLNLVIKQIIYPAKLKKRRILKLQWFPL